MANIINAFNQLDFSVATVLMIVVVIAVSTLLFYVVDTPWRISRLKTEAKQKAINAAKLDTVKTKLEILKNPNKAKYTQKYKSYLEAKSKREHEINAKITTAYDKRLKREIHRQIEVEKQITAEALHRADIQRQALKELVGEEQANATKIDLDVIKQEIHSEMLAAAQHNANCEMTDAVIDAICAPRVGFIFEF